MPYNELRKDYLLDRWVVIATERSRRPTDFAKSKLEPAKTAVCPMCVGNENMTPPAEMLYQRENGEIKRSQDPATGERTKNWLVRVIPNLYPAFSPPKQAGDEKQIVRGEGLWNAVGHHEVIVESPNHDEDPADAELPQLELVIKAYIDRLKALSAKPYVKYVSIFRNHGLEAGASLSHAHSQIIAAPMVPTTVREEQKAAQTFYEDQDKCIFCDIIEAETKGPRLISETEDFVVLAPYASVNPMEFWILPKEHAPNLLNLKAPEITAFAKTLKTSLKALKTLVNDPPYNYGIHLALNPEAQDSYHWHLEVYPKLATWAGFEKSTGIYINTVTPETAAESLRNAIKQQFPNILF
jgi:UDPglucose--hexose-1-phosphate uridylyltransferase